MKTCMYESSERILFGPVSFSENMQYNVQDVPLATEPGISLIILKPMKYCKEI